MIALDKHKHDSWRAMSMLKASLLVFLFDVLFRHIQYVYVCIYIHVYVYTSSFVPLLYYYNIEQNNKCSLTRKKKKEYRHTRETVTFLKKKSELGGRSYCIYIHSHILIASCSLFLSMFFFVLFLRWQFIS